MLKEYTEKLLFLKRFIGAPTRVGSITPSSRFLARAMLSPGDWSAARAIAELGAGTGVFTRRINRRIAPGCRLFVFEIDPVMRAKLETECPGPEYHPDAALLDDVVRSCGAGKLDYILSSLPFAVFPAELRSRILDAVRSAIAPTGTFIAFQYSQQMRQELEARFEEVRISFVLRNIPPAFVYRCTKPRR